jgi:beta-N-acetylhexosaminidase
VNTIEDLVGERLMIGLSGPSLTEDDLRTLAETRAGGVILYRRNFESPAQLLRLLHDLDAAAGRRLLVSTDHEGGRVVMLGQGTTIFPDNLALGRGGGVDDAARQGAIEGRELRRLGVHLNLGPTLDVLTERYSPNIGIRSYGEDPARVIALGEARLRAMQAAGVSACAKHFPGKGHSPLDAHLRLATIDSTEEEMRARHLPPFVAAIAAGVDCVMTSHPIYPHLDPTRALATFSRRIVTGLLREELGFQGVIVSDDLEMGAISEATTVGDAAVRAAAAGHDLLLVCHKGAAQRAAAAALVKAYREGALAAGELEASAARVRALRDRRVAREDTGPPHAEPQGRALAASIATRSVRMVSEGKAGVARPLEGRVAVIFPRFADLAARITIEPEVMDARAFVSHHFAGTRAAPETVLVGIEPTSAELEAAAAHAASADTTLLLLYDAHLYPTNRALLDVVQAKARALAVVLLRDPWDAALLAPGVTGVTAWGWRVCQLEACLARLLRA